MSDRLPETVKPFGLAETGQKLSGFIPMAELQRLKPVLSNSAGIITVILEFGTDVQRIKYVHGYMDARLGLICQRCRQDVSYPVKLEFMLGLVGNLDEANRLPSDYEPLIIDGKTISLYDIVEDEIMLALPIVARHPEAECQLKQPVNRIVKKDSDHDEFVANKKLNPFDVLASLKKGRS